MKTKLLKTFASYKEILPEIDRLDKLFIQTFGRGRKSNLVFSESGSKYKPIYGLAIWYDEKTVNEKEWFETQV